MPQDPRQQAPATDRNRDPILAVLQRILPPTGTVLEIASGTGQHAIYFAPRLAPRIWMPSEPTPQGRASILAWAEAEPAENLYPPLALDVCETRWPVEDERLAASAGSATLPAINAIVAINMVHIAPWAACLSLLAGANRVLSPGGILYLYGPYRRQDHPTAPSNETFDEMLRSQNPAWGLRDLETVVAAASAQAFQLQEIIEMPANNLSVIFQKSA